MAMKMKPDPTFMTAGEVVGRFRLSYQTLNYYTNLGLLQVAKRDGNQRIYNGQEVQRNLEDIDRLKGEGYPLRLISRVLTERMQAMGMGVRPAMLRGLR